MRDISPYFFLLPALIYLIVISIYPLIFSLTLSFHKWDLVAAEKNWVFLGLDNYINIVTKDSEFWTSLFITLKFVFFAVSIEFLLGLGFALLLNREIRMKRIIVTLMIIPMMLTPVVVGIMWRNIYNPRYGLVAHFLYLFGFTQEVPWLGDVNLAFISVLITEVWQWSPFFMLTLLAGLQSMPKEPYEAAMVDGASKIKIFIHITLPLLMPIIITTILIRVIDVIKLFDVVWIMTKGGPGFSTTTSTIYIYLQAFKYWFMGYSSALSYTLLLITAITIAILLRILRRYR